MQIFELDPSQVITLNDYPVNSDDMLIKYFRMCELGEKLAFVPLIKKNAVKPYLSDNLRKIFEVFEKKHGKAEYFMLDGSHRTTALSLRGSKIPAIVYEKDRDIIEAKKLVASGQILENGTLYHTMEENCKILNKHFNSKPYFMTVRQKTKKMLNEKVLPKM
ncbi:MAG: hypothetical protein ABII02_03810 [Candidatus Magasanikbacteria bacterium]